MSQLEKQFTGLVNQILEKQPPHAKCQHTTPDPFTGRPTPASELGHKFCPKCGARL